MTYVGYLSSRFLRRLTACKKYRKICQKSTLFGERWPDSFSNFPTSGSGKCTYVTSTSPLYNSETEAGFEVTFKRSNGEKIVAKGKEGDSLLDVVNNNHLDLDGYGQCDGTLACSTCHVIMHKKDFDAVEDELSSLEGDLLDDAFGKGPTSRLGCQVKLTKKLGNFEVQLPDFARDLRER